MKTSDSIAALASALAKAQGEIDTAKKDANNPHFKTKYADLASVWDACRDALSKNGIAVVQAPGTDDSGAVTMTTTLAHSSGEWMSSTMACRPAKPDAQSIGSVITYLRRYALSSMVGVAPEEDDGNAASGRDDRHGDMAPAGRQKPQEAPPPAKPTTATDLAAYWKRFYERDNLSLEADSSKGGSFSAERFSKGISGAIAHAESTFNLHKLVSENADLIDGNPAKDAINAASKSRMEALELSEQRMAG